MPIIVVGNITVGGVGKTPVVIAIVQHLQSLGYKPAVISRGYGGQQAQFPFPVDANSDPVYAGDEPVLIAKRCACPVVIDPQRINAAVYAIQYYDCDVLVSDDGLQHYALPRFFELAVVDGSRGLGNEQLLPAGPLREPRARLDTVDAVLVNGITDDSLLAQYPQFSVITNGLINILSGSECDADEWQPKDTDTALAAIGNPQRFQETLQSMGIATNVISLPDHHQLQPADIPSDATRIIMTEKDAVKCASFNDDRLWYVPISACLPESLLSQLEQQLLSFKEAQ